MIVSIRKDMLMAAAAVGSHFCQTQPPSTATDSSSTSFALRIIAMFKLYFFNNNGIIVNNNNVGFVTVKQDSPSATATIVFARGIAGERI